MMERFSKLALVCLLAVSGLLACKKKEGIDIKDTTSPEITLTGFSKNDTLRNIVSAEIKGQHASGIKSIEVFANDSLIASTTSDALSLIWNTLGMEDGDYDITAVINDNAGNKKELKTSIVVNNALIIIEKSMVINPFHETADYFITNTEGQVLSKANFSYNTIGGDKIRLYPTDPYTDTKVNLVRVSKATDFPDLIEYFVSIERGQYLTNQNTAGKNIREKSRNSPIPITITNVPDYNHLIVSSDVASFSFPLYQNEAYELPYSPDSKVLVQIEQNDKAKYKLFDIPTGSSFLEIDATLCDQPATKKTITFPFTVEDGYIVANGNPYEGFWENHTFADKRFSGNSVDIFYPDDLFHTMTGTVWYNQNKINYIQHYFDGLPTVIDWANLDVNIKNSSLSNFDADIQGDFSYYSVLYTNKVYMGIEDNEYMELLVYAPKGQDKFQFPDINSEIEIDAFNPTNFSPIRLTMYQYDVPSNTSYQLNNVSNVIKPANASHLFTATLDLK